MTSRNRQKLFLSLQISLFCLSIALHPPQKGNERVSAAEISSSQISKLANGSPSQADILSLKRLGTPVVKVLSSVAQNDQEKLKVRLFAIGVLGEMGVDAKSAVPTLAQAARDRNASIRLKAIRALAEIGPVAKSAIPDLSVALKDTDEQVRLEAANALGKMGDAAKTAVPSLVEALSDPRQAVRVSAIHALSSLGAEAKPAMADLTQALSDPQREVRVSAIVALGRLGEASKGAVPMLAQSLNDPDKDIRLKATTALGVLAQKPARRFLNWLKHCDTAIATLDRLPRSPWAKLDLGQRWPFLN
ncbi:MAG: hypothetical protein HC780_05480 [Leptolyngbyaceae cyanobacterium CSU_1_3]|nr:hypothetical protein [Leptolyngbyaceae cyanobacterium CSU_1_3]